MTVQTQAETGQPGWEHFHHVADIGVRGIGKTMANAFEQAALAMTAVITDPACIKQKQTVNIACPEAPDDEYLFNDWLNAIVYEMDTRKMLFSRFQVTIMDHTLAGKAWGEQVDMQKHTPAVEVKGATLTALKVEQQGNGLWIAQCVVDV